MSVQEDTNLPVEPKAAKAFSASRSADILNNWRLTPATLMAHLDKSWVPAKWLQYLSLKIATAVAKGNCGLLISAPPRHGKSMLSTIATPTWILENFPGKNVIVATYGEDLSTDFTRQVRDLIQQNQGELNVRLRADARRVANLLTTEGGGLKAVGLQGAITGRGADVLIIDDYIKNSKEAMSPQYLQDLWDWWTSTARTRLEPGAVVIILATRWVAKDLHGRIMERQRTTGRNFFEYVELPAIAHSDDDPIGRAKGEILFKERYDKDAIEEIKAELGSRWFNAMFQQKPDDDESKAVNTEWFKPLTLPEFERRYQQMLDNGDTASLTWIRAWDLASTKEAGDYTSGAFCLYDRLTKNFYIRNIRRGQWSSHKVEEKFLQASKEDEAYARSANVLYKVGMEQEPGSSGVYTIKHFRELLRDSDGVTASLKEQRATTSKLLNAQPLLAAAEDGKVFVVADYNEQGLITGWVKEFLAELEDFPESEYDDQVDSVSQAFKLATGKSFLKPTFGRAKQQATNAVRRTGDMAQIAKKRVGVTFGRALARVR